MSGFAIRNPYFIVVICLFIAVVGVTSLARMPIDMFPAMNIPVVVVATFYSGMPPEQIETDITSRFERFFTLGSGIEHIESRSLPGVSIIKVFFQPGTNPDSAVTTISNLAMAQLRRLPPGTLPPVVLKFDASSLPVCLVTFKGEGLDETSLRDLAQFQVRNHIPSVPGASVPQPFGGRGQPSVYLPVLKQGGDTNTIAVVDGIKAAVQHLFDVPKELVSKVVFDQSIFVKTAIETLLHEGAIGLFLTSIMILIFLGSMRATVAVFFSIPLSALAAFIALSMGGGSINSMVLGGLALAFSRLIDNSVVVLENIYRHLELGET